MLAKEAIRHNGIYLKVIRSLSCILQSWDIVLLSLGKVREKSDRSLFTFRVKQLITLPENS